MKILKVFLKDCSPWRTHVGAGEESEEEKATERNHYVLTAASHLPEKLEVKESSWEWRRWK